MRPLDVPLSQLINLTFTIDFRGKEKLRLRREIEKCGAKHYVPFAGFFTEAYPADDKIQNINKKNKPDDVKEFLRGIDTIILRPGSMIDIKTGEVTHKYLTDEECINTQWDFEYMDRKIRTAQDSFIDLSSVEEYFKKAGFQADDFVLHVMETSIDFETTFREYYIDFEEVTLHDRIDDVNFAVWQRDHTYSIRKRYLRMKVKVRLLCRGQLLSLL